MKLLTSPAAIAAALTAGFLVACGEGGPLTHSLITRYALGHPLAVATVALFFAGAAAVAMRAVGHRSERSAVAALAECRFEYDADALTWAGDSKLAAPARVRGLLLDPPPADRAEARLTTLHETAADRLHDSYGLVRTITWAVPILGFLGTVVGITLAIAGIDPDGLGESLGEVTGGLAVAFDTTALALALSLVLVFSTHAVQGAELSNLERLRDAAFRTLLPLCPAVEDDPIRAAASDVADQMRRRAGDLAEVHAAAWRGSLEEMRTAWSETLSESRAVFAEGVRAETSAVVEAAERRQQAAANEFLSAVRAASESMTGAVSRWSDGIERAADAEIDRADRLGQLAESMERLAERAEAQAMIAGRIDAGLASVHEAGQFEEAVHSLTAAAHLLTVRLGSVQTQQGAASAPAPLRRAA
ncbi:MotA/TolQ/ExbB proton channel family protein [Alienimonas chondri]|uniref:MotA/TolQ/ExbB proton channel family protein n=1 Tax=Alienimonas chondri TaxID=2681879 RepID=UPI0014885680|nr:MotA/TolQ/ExbB proton channel family protein [Alienimonas chondri]